MAEKTYKMVIKVGKVADGHKPHFTGAGAHADKRTKRLRTRSQRNSNAIKEWNTGD